MRNNNRVTECLAGEVQGDMDELFINVDPPIYARNLLEDNIFCAMKILTVEDLV